MKGTRNLAYSNLYDKLFSVSKAQQQTILQYINNHSDSDVTPLATNTGREE